MTITRRLALGAAMATALVSTAFAETTLTIATVNNGDMIRMQGLTDDFTKDNPDIKLNWVTLEENDLRQKVTKDISTKGGQYDILTIGMYETRSGARRLARAAHRPRRSGGYPAGRVGRSFRQWHALCRALLWRILLRHVMYRKDLMAKAGLTCPTRRPGTSSSRPPTR